MARRSSWPAFIGLVVAATLSASSYVLLQSRNNPHAKLIYLALLYVTVLPPLALYWRPGKRAEKQALAIPNLAIPAAIVFFIAAVWISLSIGHGRMISDESAYRFQAQIFASGKLKAPAMPGAGANPAQVPIAIYFEQTVQTPGGWFAKYPPGWPMVLALGVWLHCPWLVNPVLGMLQLAVMWRLARWWGRTTQILAVMMAATSAYMVADAAGYMSHALAGLLALLALALGVEGVLQRQLRWIACGLAAAVVSTAVRPLTGAIVCVVCAAMVLLGLRTERRLWRQALATVVIAGIISAASFMAINRAFTGHALLSPYALSRGAATIQELTFNPARLVMNIASIWRWSATVTACYTFPFLFLFAAYGCLREESHRREVLWLACLFPLLMAAHVIEADGSGSFIGERYWYEGFCPLAIVAGRGLELLLERWRVPPQAAAAGLTVLLALPFVMLAEARREIAAVVRPYKEAYTLATRSPEPPLVFLHGDTAYFITKHVNWNAADWPAAPTVYLNDPGDELRDATACRFGRPGYRLIWWDAARQQMQKRDATAACAP